MRKQINEVFTPRRSEVNTEMYISRPTEENRLYRSITGTTHTFLTGESGTGKSWLYKQVLSNHKINFVIANSANAARKKSLTDEIYAVSVGANTATKTGYSESKTASLGVPALASGELQHEGHYTLELQDKLLVAYKALRKSSESSNLPAVIVIDNIETILDSPALMREIENIIILLDDHRFARYNIKLLLVGVPNDLISYFGTSKIPSSIANRIRELRPLSGMLRNQVEQLLSKGFNLELKAKIGSKELAHVAKIVHHSTLGIPQHVQEYAEALAYELEDNDWRFNLELLSNAEVEWMYGGLKSSYTAVVRHLNARSTSNGRRDQVLYTIGAMDHQEFDTNDVGYSLKHYFPANSPNNNSGIGQILANLSHGPQPLIRRTTHSTKYTFCDPRYVICIRLLLKLDDDGDIQKYFLRKTS